MRAHGLDYREVCSKLTVSFLDSLGQYGPLYHPAEVAQALDAPQQIKVAASEVAASEMVADLLVAAGRHPAAVRHLVETSGVSDNVISLVEERLRRAGHPSTVGVDRRAERGLRLIDEWSGPEAVGPEPGTAAPVAPTEPPQPPVPAA